MINRNIKTLWRSESRIELWNLNPGHHYSIFTLDNKDFCKYCQHTFNEQKSDRLYLKTIFQALVER